MTPAFAAILPPSRCGGWRIASLAPFAAALLLSAGCATLPQGVTRIPSKAIAPSSDTTLGRIVEASTPDRELSGFRLMPTGQFALNARLDLARRAERTLDVQYYQVHDDRTGRYLLRALRDASAHGVRVRLLIDDLYTSGADPLLLGLAAYSNVEVRLFNPFPAGRQHFLLRFAASAFDFSRVHRRMHNKLFIADGAIAVAGGRNIADEYFMASEGANFVDLDTFVAGAIVPRLSALFDEYWNSPRVFPIESIVRASEPPAELRARFETMTGPGTTPEPEAPPPNDVLGYAPIVHELDAGQLGLVWANAEAYADSPDKVVGRVSAYALVPMEDVDSVRYNAREQIRRARSEVVLSSPYMIPGKLGIETIQEVRERNVRVTILTNSLAATDEPAVHTGYRRYRPQMLDLDVELYEVSPLRVNRSIRLGRFGTSIGRLHAKTAVIDHERIFIGSMNFDPRSDRYNTELGLFVESPQLAQQVLKLIDTIKQQGAYRVRMAADRKSVEWVVAGAAGEEILIDEPEADFWTRVMLEVVSWLAPEDLL